MANNHQREKKKGGDGVLKVHIINISFAVGGRGRLGTAGSSTVLTSILLSSDPALLRRPRLPAQDMQHHRLETCTTHQLSLNREVGGWVGRGNVGGGRSKGIKIGASIYQILTVSLYDSKQMREREIEREGLGREERRGE